jgi:glycosyltransferase involved in cell wall biosynthesis
MKENKVSVIVTCYNQEDCIIRTLESVSNQTYSNWECIVVDDESNDRSNIIIKQYFRNKKVLGKSKLRTL